MRVSKWIWAAVHLAGVAATIWLLWFSNIPLGVPGEWVWDRIAFDNKLLHETSLGWGIAGIATVVYLLFCSIADRRVLDANRWEMASWLAALTVVGAIWHGVVQECPPEPHRLTKAAWGIWYRSTQGYYSEAHDHDGDTKSYVADYSARLKQGDVLHFGTHPPGLALLHRTIIGMVKRWPKLKSWLLAYQPDSVTAAMDVLAETNKNSMRPFDDTDRAAVWLASILAALAAMSTVVPLFCLVRRTCNREVAWRVACFWPLIPALAVFHPVSDLWLPVFGTSFLAVWGEAWTKRSILLGVVAGGIIWCGMLLSLAMLPIAFLAALWTLADAAFGETTDPLGTRASHLAACVVSALASFIAMSLFVRWLWGLELGEVWIQNFKNHAGFYSQFKRTTSSWLIVNPLELILAAGTPVFLMALTQWLSGTRGSLRSAQSFASFRLWCLVTILVLWLSGKNSGEAARLWIFLLPWLLWVSGREAKITAKIVNGPGQTLPEYTGTPSRGWITLLLLQAIVCTATVSRIDAFKFATTVPIPAVDETAQTNK